MLFENCTFHIGQQKNIVVEGQQGVELVCKECFEADVSENERYGVILCDGTMQYFFQWNHYIIDQLRSLLEIISKQGTDFLIKIFTKTIQKEKSQLIGHKATSDLKFKQVLSFVISQHINLLNQNVAFMSQPQSFIELINPQFLCDLLTITTKTVQHILDPIKKEFQAILKKQFNQECHVEWNNQVVDVIENLRLQILNDWTKGCILEKAVSKSIISKTQSQESNKIKTQHSIDRSRSSCVSLSFDDQIEKIDLSQCVDFEIGSQDNEIIDRTESYVIDTKKENQMLLKMLKTKQEEIQILNQKLAESEQKCQEWMKKYYILQGDHKDIVQQRIPTIQIQFQDLQNSMNLVMEENDLFLHQIHQLQTKLSQLNNENIKLKSEKSSYYVNPYYEKQKSDQKLFTQVIELQSQIMLKTDDISALVNCLKQTKIFLQNKNFQNNINFIINWQKQMIGKLKSLQTLTIKSL